MGMLTVYLVEFLLTHCMVPSKIENFFIILDFNNVGMTQIPKSLLQAMIQTM